MCPRILNPHVDHINHICQLVIGSLNKLDIK